MNIKHFEIRRTFSFFFFFLFCGGGGWGFKEALEVGVDLHILIPSPSTVSFSNHRALNLKKNADFRKAFRNRTNICKGHKVFSEALDPKED